MLLAQIYSSVLCLLYGAILFNCARRFSQGVKAKTIAARYLPAIVMVAHLAFLFFLTLCPHGSLVSSFAGSLSALALGLAFSFFIIEWATGEKNMGLWIMGLPLVFQLLATTQMREAVASTTMPEMPLVLVHVAAALVGYCAFSLSAAFSAMYLVQYRAIKGHRLGLIFERLPSLEKLESMGYRAVHFGLGFLLAGLALGYPSFPGSSAESHP